MTTSYNQIKDKAATVEANFSTKWGAVRRFLSAHPLTGAWCFFGAGALAMFAACSFGLVV